MLRTVGTLIGDIDTPQPSKALCPIKTAGSKYHVRGHSRTHGQAAVAYLCIGLPLGHAKDAVVIAAQCG